MKKSSIKILEARILALNKALNRPETPWLLEGDKYVALVGSFQLYLALGVFAVEEICSKGGGVNRILTASSKSGLLHELDALLLGVKLAKGNA